MPVIDPWHKNHEVRQRLQYQLEFGFWVLGVQFLSQTSKGSEGGRLNL